MDNRPACVSMKGFQHLLLEVPLLHKTWMMLPGEIAPKKPESIEEMLLMMDYVANTTPGKDIVPACFGEIVTDQTVDDRWMYFAAVYHEQTPEWQHANGLGLRSPRDSHTEVFDAIKAEWSLLNRIVQEQDYSVAAMDARVAARRITAAAILKLAMDTRVRLPVHSRDAMIVAADALHVALTKGTARLHFLKSTESKLSFNDAEESVYTPARLRLQNRDWVIPAREQVACGFLELQEMFEQTLTEKVEVERDLFPHSKKRICNWEHVSIVKQVKCQHMTRAMAPASRTRSGKEF